MTARSRVELMKMCKVVIAGAGGRMGRTLVRLIAESADLTLVGAIEHSASPHLGADAATLSGLPPLGVVITADQAAALKGADAVIDFTLPDATMALLAETKAAGLVHVIGTTGFSAEQEAAIRAAGQSAVIIKSGNMSLGVNLLAAMVKKVAAALDEDFDIEIVEMHHNKKIDAPSGTALLLGEAAAEGREISLANHSERGRDGHTGARERGAIGFASLRGGTVIGDHTVTFAGPYERIELSHKAEDRGIFARGALKAAQWGTGRPPGFYTMADVLGLSDR